MMWLDLLQQLQLWMTVTQIEEAFVMNFDEIKEQIINPIDVTDQFDPADISTNKGVSIVGCFPCLFWIPLVAAKDSAFGKFYANQGLITLILSIASGVVSAILGFIPFIGGILGGLLGTVLGLCSTASFLFTIINAAQGKAKPVPVIGQMLNIIK